MKISDEGLKLLMQREGVRLKAYRDSIGVLTIGCGHTGRMSPPRVFTGQVITSEQAMAYLRTDLKPVEATINTALRGHEVTQDQYDAMVSLAFNIGVHGFIGSSVLRDVLHGDERAAADAFLMWEHPPELKLRRESERRQFLGKAP